MITRKMPTKASNEYNKRHLTSISIKHCVFEKEKNESVTLSAPKNEFR